LNTIDSVFRQLIQYLGCFSVAIVAVAATTVERELQCRCRVGNNMAMLATIWQC